MPVHTLKPWQHQHDFSLHREQAEGRTRWVMLITFAMMLVEVTCGTMWGSMALLADGWHMATHVAAFGISIYAYNYARINASQSRFTFGTGKVNVLGGFASAIALGVIAFLMAMESILRLFHPEAIRFDDALLVAVLGLVVNAVCGYILGGSDHHHDHGHDHDKEHHHDHDEVGHHDHNLRSAYMHVLADALTSVLAIAALLAGKYFGLSWLDPVTGLVGAVVIAIWARGLIRDTSLILLDGSVGEDIKARIRLALEGEPDTNVADLHVWHVSEDAMSAAVSLVTHHPKDPAYYKKMLAGIKELVHVQVEVNTCHEKSCAGP